METRSVRRKMLVNRFDDLPDDILHIILNLLPIKSAAQTAVLSRRWVKVFSSIPDLDFTTVYSEPNDKDIVMKNVLENYDPTFSIRTLKIETNLSSICIASLLGYAARHNVQDLFLLLPTRFDRCGFLWKKLMDNKSLKVLWLGSMHLTVDLKQYWLIDSTFKSLQSMTLSKMCLAAQGRTLILSDSMFPCLKKLTLAWCFHQAGLKISCSELTDLALKQCYSLNALDVFGKKLERLTVDACFTNHLNPNSRINIVAPVIKYLEWVNNQLVHIPVLGKSPLLEKALISSRYIDEDLQAYIDGPEYSSWRCRLFNVIIVLSNVKVLKVHHPLTEIFSLYDIGSISINKFERLRKLEISCQVKEFYHFQGITALLRHAPYVETLVIKIDPVHQYIIESNADIYWGDEIPEIISFLNHVKTVKIVGFLEYAKQLCSFVEFLLEHGKVLENMTLYLGRPNARLNRWTRIKSIMKLAWASSKVTKAMEKCRYLIYAKAYIYKVLLRLVV